MERIVVGVDGSEGSRAALRWSLTYAEHTGAVVEAVSAFHYASSLTPVAGLPALPAFGDVKADAEERLVATLKATVPDASDVRIEHLVQEGPSARVLLRRAAKADLLVVGSRGFGGFRGLLLGSVSHQCVTHAPCPVVVVPEVGAPA